jgi:hypothetical protein
MSDHVLLELCPGAAKMAHNGSKSGRKFTSWGVKILMAEVFRFPDPPRASATQEHSSRKAVPRRRCERP